MRVTPASPMRLLLALSLVAHASANGATFRAPRLPDGRPDLQGIWVMTNATPLERPADIGTLTISPAQAATIESGIAARDQNRVAPTDSDDRHVERVQGTLRSSLIVEPKDGKLPGTPWFAETARRTRQMIMSAPDGPEGRPPSERCLSSTQQPPIRSLPAANYHQIVQTADAVLLFGELGNAARIVRLRSTHIPAAITSWQGDSIGWWEGATLVVETKQFAPGSDMRGSPEYTFFVSPQATVTERFTRIARDELLYEFAIADPTYYAQVWRGETHLLRTDQRIFEYACHEGNYGMAWSLQAARAREKTN